MNDIISLSAKKPSSHEIEKNVGPLNNTREKKNRQHPKQMNDIIIALSDKKPSSHKIEKNVIEWDSNWGVFKTSR